MCGASQKCLRIWRPARTAFYIREVLDEMGRPPSSASEHFPVAVVGLHGLLAATTIVLVLLTNVGVGGS
jgi:hypothetical protein